MRKKSIYAICLALALCSATFASIGCNAGNSSSARSDTSQAASGQYAHQIETLHQTRVNAKGIVIGHAPDILRDICEAPTVRDQNGDPVFDANGNVQMIEESYDEATKSYDINKLSDEKLLEMNLATGCVSCKTSHFNELYGMQGAAAFGSPYNAEARAVVNGDYFDCGLCHEGEPSAKNLQPSLMYFQALGDGLADRIDERNGVCAQCHNSYDYRSAIKTEDDLRTIKAYRNGYDVDGLFEASWEDGVNFDWDPDTGIATSYVLHPTIELFMGTKMQLLGVTCADCHMPKSVDADGQEFTNHFSANSPLESEDALTYCLNCHEQQGIESTTRMAEYVRERERQMAAGMAKLAKREASFREALEQAVAERGKDDPSLDDAKKLYAKVTWYEKCLETGPSESAGSQASMLDWEGILKKADAACDEGVELLG